MYNNVIVIGYHEIASILLEKLVDFNFNVKTFIPNNIRKQQNDWYRDAEEVATKYNIPILKTKFLKKEKNPNLYKTLETMDLDIIFSAYSSFIFPEELINLPKLGCFNFHPSLLPKDRGSGAGIWPIKRGDSETALTLHWMTKEIDNGDIVTSMKIAIDPQDTIKRHYEKIFFTFSKILQDYLPKFKSGNIKRIAQDNSRANYKNFNYEKDARINFSDDVNKVCNTVRAFAYPFPGAFFKYQNDKVKILEVNKHEFNENLKHYKDGEIISIEDYDIIVKFSNGLIKLKDIKIDNRHLLPAHWASIKGIKKGDNLENKVIL